MPAPSLHERTHLAARRGATAARAKMARQRAIVLLAVVGLLCMQWLALAHGVGHGVGHRHAGLSHASGAPHPALQADHDADHDVDHRHPQAVAAATPAGYLAVWPALLLAGEHDEGSATCGLIDQLLSGDAWTAPVPAAAPADRAGVTPWGDRHVRVADALGAYEARAPPGA